MEKSTDYVIKKIAANNLNLSIDFYLQPIFDMTNFTCQGGEVLARGICRRNIVPPVYFINKLEENGGIIPMGEYIIGQTFEYISSVLSGKGKCYFLSVNISDVQLEQEDFSERVIARFKQYGFDANRIILEITESDKLPSEIGRRNIFNLKDFGFFIAWDDIQDAEELEKKLAFAPSDYIKFDRKCLGSAFINDTFKMIDRVKASEAEVIIEGVESYGHVSMMLKHDVRLAQGFLFSRPLKKETFKEKFVDTL